jgi:hypothetical protein
MSTHFRSNGSICIALLTVLTALIFSGCGPKLLNAVWLAPSLRVENQPDWWNMPAYQNSDLSGRVIVANDSNSLYLGLYSSDHRLAGRLKGRGLTVWLSNPDNKNNRLGLRYPVGMWESGANIRPNRYLPSADLSPDAMDDMLKLQNDDVEFMCRDSALSGRKTPEAADSLGVHARFVQTQTALEYTMQIRFSGPVLSWLKPGARVQVALDSPAMSRPKGRAEGRPDEGGRQHGGGFGGGEGRRGGGMGRRGAGGEEGEGGSREQGLAPNQALHLVYTIQLASGPKP